jgi:hypothetical protein
MQFAATTYSNRWNTHFQQGTEFQISNIGQQQKQHCKDLGRENHTIFGHGEGHDLLTDDPMTNPVYDNFLDGTFMDTEHLQDRTYGQNLFIKHMKSKLPGGVEEELKAMAETMSLKEWRKFFLTA